MPRFVVKYPAWLRATRQDPRRFFFVDEGEAMEVGLVRVHFGVGDIKPPAVQTQLTRGHALGHVGVSAQVIDLFQHV